MNGHEWRRIWEPDVEAESGVKARDYKRPKSCAGRAFVSADTPDGLFQSIAPGWAYCPCCPFVRRLGLEPLR